MKADWLGSGRPVGGVRLASVSERRRKHWGWGFEDEQPSRSELAAQAQAVAAHLGFGFSEPEEPVALASLALPPPRLEPRASSPTCVRTMSMHAPATPWDAPTATW